jgi:hypothetical protein
MPKNANNVNKICLAEFERIRDQGEKTIRLYRIIFDTVDNAHGVFQ